MIIERGLTTQPINMRTQAVGRSESPMIKTMDITRNLSSGTRNVTPRMPGCLPLFLRMAIMQGARKIPTDMVNDGY